MGASFGGMVEQELALRHPQVVERLVLCCTSSGGAGGSSYPLRELANLPEKERVRRSIHRMDIRMDSAWQAANPEQFKVMFDQMMAGQRAGTNDPKSQMGARRQPKARADHDTYERLPSFGMQVYLCGGRSDDQAEPANLEAMRKQIPEARLEFFERGTYFHTRIPWLSNTSRHSCYKRAMILQRVTQDEGAAVVRKSF